ncbi:GNAT family acetyltransferase [Marinomonas sp. C2222]|uniref:GNAT family acetyltransferase n=1 Tax=Marinomonas sargassi TaxID=2984494 RepID=A0ABT2YTB9_9GAMM|nr:GNAT family acetyltransferase [Marinomonas sargassi]MCV2403148.1 GNAT family acetyltransferase [Marinomonas sargassi]
MRKFESNDRDALIQLWETVFPDDPPHNEPAAVLRAKLEVDDLVFVAESNGKIVGACMAGYDGHRGWLYAVAVYKEHRRNGTGAELVKHAMAALKELGCIKVNLQIRVTNTQVAAFYESLGFSVEERLSMGAFL